MRRETEIVNEIRKHRHAIGALKDELKELEGPRPNIWDTKGKVYKLNDPRSKILWKFGRKKVDSSYRPHYNFDVVTIRLDRVDGGRSRWVQQSEFECDYREVTP